MPKTSETTFNLPQVKQSAEGTAQSLQWQDMEVVVKYIWEIHERGPYALLEEKAKTATTSAYLIGVKLFPDPKCGDW